MAYRVCSIRSYCSIVLQCIALISFVSMICTCDCFIGTVLCTVDGMGNDLCRKCEWKFRLASAKSKVLRQTTKGIFPIFAPSNFEALRFLLGGQLLRRINEQHILLGRECH